MSDHKYEVDQVVHDDEGNKGVVKEYLGDDSTGEWYRVRITCGVGVGLDEQWHESIIITGGDNEC